MTTAPCPFANGDIVEVHGLTADEEHMQRAKNGDRLTVDDREAVHQHYAGFCGWYIFCVDARKLPSFHAAKHLRKVG
jgi:hypothetical protein